MTDKDFDDILTALGTSKWNYFHYFVVALTGFMMPAILISGAFVTPNIDHKCNTDTFENVTKIEECFFMDSNNETKTCSSWEYDSEYFPNSMTNEFNLVCDKSYLRPTFQTSYMFGNFIGAPINGFLSDKFGRKKWILIGNIVMVSAGMISTFLTNVFAIIFLRFIMGVFHASARTTGYILCLEITEKKHRSDVGILQGLPWAFGAIWYGILGYFLRDWRWLQRVILIPGFLGLIGLRYFSESPRWLIVNGKFSEALESLRHAAQLNNSVLPSEEELINRMKRIQKLSLSEIRSGKSGKTKKEMVMNAVSYVTVLFKTPAIRKLSILMYLLFFSAALVYYGLTLNATNFDLNPYMYMIVGGFVEMPAYTVIIPIINKFGRIPPTAISYIACGVVILVLAFISNEPKWLIIILAMAGRLFISVAFMLLYLVASEAYPTEVRMQGIGTSQLSSRIGSIIAPYITDLVTAAYLWVPSIIFGTVSIVSGGLMYLVPETLNVHLPETISSLELTYSQKKMQKKDKSSESTISSPNKAIDPPAEI